jgi:hypothetical protein
MVFLVKRSFAKEERDREILSPPPFSLLILLIYSRLL